MSPSTPEDDPRPLRVTIVGGAGVRSESQRSRLWRDVSLVVLSVVLSGAVAFGVARYTVDHDDRIQREAEARQKLSAIYLSLSSTVAKVIACVAPNLCSESELLRANRAANAAAVAVIGQGSTSVNDLMTALNGTLRTIVEDRLNGKRPSTALLTRASKRLIAVETEISKELDR